MIGFHHRTVIQLQFCIQVSVFVVQRLTHDFPSVIVHEDNLWLEGGFHKIKFTVGTLCSHVNSLEPVVLVLVLPTGTCIVCLPSNPWSGIDKSLIGMPFLRQQLLLLRSQDDIIAITLCICHLGITQFVLYCRVILPVLLKTIHRVALVVNDGNQLTMTIGTRQHHIFCRGRTGCCLFLRG